MKLKQIVCDKTALTLTKEKKVVNYGEEFEVTEARAKEILKATYKDEPVAAIVEEVVEPTEEAKTKAPKTTKKNK